MTDLVDGNDASRRPIKRALVSVYDKTGIVELAQAFQASGGVRFARRRIR